MDCVSRTPQNLRATQILRIFAVFCELVIWTNFSRKGRLRGAKRSQLSQFQPEKHLEGAKKILFLLRRAWQTFLLIQTLTLISKNERNDQFSFFFLVFPIESYLFLPIGRSQIARKKHAGLLYMMGTCCAHETLTLISKLKRRCFFVLDAPGGGHSVLPVEVHQVAQKKRPSLGNMMGTCCALQTLTLILKSKKGERKRTFSHFCPGRSAARSSKVVRIDFKSVV